MDTITENNTATITIPARDFAAAVRVVAVSAGTDKSLPMLTAMLISGGGDKPVELVATDRYRLTRARLRGVDDTGEITPLLIPAQPLAKFMSGIKFPARSWGNEVVEIFPIGGEVMIRATVAGETSSITLRLSDATFPKYQELIPTDLSGGNYSTGTNLMAVNPKLLGEIATVFSKVIGKGSGTMKLHLPNEGKRAVIFTLDTEGVEYLTLLMPVRIS